jgi:polyhydroxybutyrate depolymerase
MVAFLVLLGLILLVPLIQGLTSDLLPPDHVRGELKTPQGIREYVIHVPTTCTKTKPAPLVIMIHGFGGTAVNAAKETSWSAKADQESFIIVYPEATRPNRLKPQNFRTNPQAWNDGSGRFHAAIENIDDVAFIGELIDKIAEEYAIDFERIFITGFSNGASMTFRLGAELSQKIAAIAPVAGTSWIENPNPQPAISVCYITGTTDTLNPINGGSPKLAFGGKDQGERAKPPVQHFIDQWLMGIDCPLTPTLDETSNTVRKRVYSNGRDHTELIYITVENHGHHWPGGEGQLPNFLAGKQSDKLNATNAVWEFFKSHPASK